MRLRADRAAIRDSPISPILNRNTLIDPHYRRSGGTGNMAGNLWRQTGLLVAPRRAPSVVEGQTSVYVREAKPGDRYIIDKPSTRERSSSNPVTSSPAKRAPIERGMSPRPSTARFFDFASIISIDITETRAQACSLQFQVRLVGQLCRLITHLRGST